MGNDICIQLSGSGICNEHWRVICPKCGTALTYSKEYVSETGCEREWLCPGCRTAGTEHHRGELGAEGYNYYFTHHTMVGTE